MLATNSRAFKQEFKRFCDLCNNEGETVIITRNKGEKNVVVIGMDEWNRMQKAINNAEYLQKIDRALNDIKNGNIIRKTIEELEALENE